MGKKDLFLVIWETILILLSMLLYVKIPLYIQEPLNNQFKDWFSPPGSIIISLHLRVISTLVCFVITYIPVFIILKFAKATKTLHILFLICTFLSCVIIAYAIYASR